MRSLLEAPLFFDINEMLVCIALASLYSCYEYKNHYDDSFGNAGGNYGFIKSV